jgi:hypothetical protein
LGCETASSSSNASRIWSYGELCMLVACLSLASHSNFFLLYSAISNSYLTLASLRC